MDTPNQIDRRGFFRIGGVAVATAVVFGACGDDEPATVAAEPEKPAAPVSRGDVNTLRTMTSIELLAVDVYTEAQAANLVTTTSATDAVKLFLDHHKEHANRLQAATVKAGGEAFVQPNPVLVTSLRPARAAATSQSGVLALLLDLESVAAQTYQASVAGFTDKTLNRTVMSIGGITARHVAVLRAASGQPAVTEVFQTTPRAVSTSAAV